MGLANLRSRSYINLKDYCKIDGTTDDSTGFTAAYTLASTLGMSLLHPGGTLIKGNDTVLSNVRIRGAGPGASIIKLKNAANVDLFSANTGSINLSASFGVGSNTGVSYWGFEDITLDGNKANQSSGTSYCLRVYGYAFSIINVEMKDGYSGNWLNDFNGSNPDLDDYVTIGRVIGLQSKSSHGVGIEFGGPHDTIFTDVESGFHYTHSIHICPNAAGAQFTNCHAWSPTQYGSVGGQDCAWLVEGGPFFFTDCEAEGARGGIPQVALLGSNNSWIGGKVFSSSGDAGSGLQLGQQAGNTPYVNQVYQSAGVTTAISAASNYISTAFKECTGTYGAINFANDGGNTILADITQDAGSYFTGTLNNGTTFIPNVHGLTADGTQHKGGYHQLVSSSFNGLIVQNPSGTQSLVVDTYDGVVNFPGGVQGTSGGSATWILKNGTFAPLSSTSAAATATSGTITTSGVGVARVAPTGNITGAILQAGTLEGQEVVVRNESAFSVTFAASGTSHVAAGTAVVIPANTSQLFSWNNSNSLWY